MMECKGMRRMSSINQREMTVQGMVLRSAPQGDYDRRLVLLTKEKGKITVFARGARKSSNALAGKTNPFSFGNFLIGSGSSAYYLKQAEIINYFMEMGQDYERNCYGCYFLEFADYYSREDTEGLQMLKLLYQSLRALLKDSIPNRLVQNIFELKAMVINGEYPEVFTCMSCQKELSEGYFSVFRGGVYCPACHKNITDGMYIDGSLLYAMQYIITAKIEKLYTFVLKEDISKNFNRIMINYRRHYIDNEFKSLALLEEL